MVTITSDFPNYICGYCGRAVVGEIMFDHKVVSNYFDHPKPDVALLGCPNCHEVTFYNKDNLYPPAVGYDISHLADNVKQAYREAKTAFDSKSYLACVLVCRTIIMYTAVDKGAKENERFASYVDHLVGSGLITQQMKEFATEVRDNGNRAAHDIDAPSVTVARRTLDFTTKLLRQVYEDVKMDRDDLADDPKFTRVSTPRPKLL